MENKVPVPVEPGGRTYNRGGRPGLNVDFKADCGTVLGAWQGNGETVTEVAARFGSAGVGFISECTRNWDSRTQRLYPVKP